MMKIVFQSFLFIKKKEGKQEKGNSEPSHQHLQ